MRARPRPAQSGWRVRVPAQSSLQVNSDLLIDQVRAIDNRRLVEGPLARLDTPTMMRVAAALLEVLEVG